MLFSLILQSFAAEFILHQVQDPQAMCLDGSRGKLYIQKGAEASRILLFFQNHDSPFLPSLTKALSHFLDLSNSERGSSRNWASRLAAPSSGILSDDQAKNPHFFNWTKVILKNCDGTLFQGGRESAVSFQGRSLHFRGQKILRSQLQLLIKEIGLQNVQNSVLLGGEGWGGHAALLWSNYISGLLKGTARLFTDSSFFLNAMDLNGTLSFERKLASFLALVNQQFPLPASDCLLARSPQECLFPADLLTHQKVPTFIVQSEYDGPTLKQVLGSDCASLNSLKYCEGQQKEQIQFYRLMLTSAVARRCSPPNGCWAVACVQSGFSTSPLFESVSYRVPEHSPYSVQDSLSSWVMDQQQANDHIDLLPWPSNQPCARE